MSCLSPDATTTITSRPKLTLQTTALPRTFGTSNTGLSFSFAAAPTASPTIRNTFKNAYEVTSPSSATSPSKSTRYNKPSSPYILHPNNNIFNYRSPYQLPIGVRSILRNSPLESSTRRQSGSISAGGNGSNGPGSRRVFFPAKKQVSYRYPLEEEIRTERYTAQHLDLVTEEAVQTEADTKTPPETRPATSKPEGEKEESDSSPSLSGSASGDDTSADETVRGSSLSKTERKKRRTMRVERQVRAVALLDGFEADGSSTPQTPRQGRAKRRREWKWTLGPVDRASNNGPENVSLLQSAQVTFGSDSLRVSTDFASGH
ncbi:uncharacterized protein N7479_002217 [Penicillium vulpinum]|uniref:Uncharacterized protein n=1 Tax=Penicillium vulpinum TaxID=29845 RepID=A0A1V6S6Z6_9EURO|nr:uncharacterized protein N7479_002217 [Penicillium vulpinum]KAJ5972299.1 hypothetical protein N7479_002217 [Penicillium vulpinum]OQE09835.1 hypothetical protein PENVUL_c005G01952 [Penicillium vulpinum]